MLNLAVVVWHLHQRNVSRVHTSLGHNRAQLLEIAWNTLDELKRSEASVATAKLVVALVVVNTTDATQTWACLPALQNHLVDTARKAPSAVQIIAMWATSSGVHLLDATRAVANVAA